MDIEQKIKEAMRKDFKNLYVKEFTSAWKEHRFIRALEIGVMDIPNLMELFNAKK